MSERTKRWEMLNSIWMVWTFVPFAFLSWVSFCYIGIRTRQRKWIYWGVAYSIPFVLGAIFSGMPHTSTAWNIVTALALGTWPVSIIHAFMIRNEYLERLWVLKQKEQEQLEQLRNRIRQEYEGEGAGRPSSDRPPSPPSKVPPISRDETKEKAEPPKTPLIDLNRASEQELASLPGMNLILAKNAIKKRSEKGGFSSVEDFARSLGLKPHVTERIRRMATVRPFPKSSGPDEISSGGKGRIVDF